jgi:hypothetical protein
MIITWSEGIADYNMAEEILIELVPMLNRIGRGIQGQG